MDNTITNINQISVNIPNKYMPIVIPFGPRSCGKTMMIRRLCMYLHERGYCVKPVRDFRPSNDKYYQGICDNFLEFLYDEYASKGTNPCGMILMEILDKHGCPICYLFDAEGNCYFDPNYPNSNYHTFMYHVMCSPNPKQFIYFVEPHWGNVVDRLNYVQRITQCQAQFYNHRCKSIILYDKIDETPFISTPSKVSTKHAIMDCKNLYAGLFNIFRQQNPILRWIRPFNVVFLPFSSGTFTLTPDGCNARYMISHPIYPQMLWECILKNIS